MTSLTMAILGTSPTPCWLARGGPPGSASRCMAAVRQVANKAPTEEDILSVPAGGILKATVASALLVATQFAVSTTWLSPGDSPRRQSLGHSAHKHTSSPSCRR